MVEDVEVELPVGRRAFRFQLRRKEERLSTVEIDQWWMRDDSLDPTRNRERSAANFGPAVDYFWALCRREGSDLEPDVREAYLLARLLPASRSNGSREVMTDSAPDGPIRTAKARAARRASDRELDDLLRGGPPGELDELTFSRRTDELVGRSSYPEEAWRLYGDVTGGLLADARDAVGRPGDTAFEAVAAAWLELTRKFARRGELERLVLDVISYECRAALHQCLSAVWCGLVPVLERDRGLSREGVGFHAFWQLDLRRPAAETAAAYFHVFHGHVFGLHPAGADFIRTSTGRGLLGEWLAAGGREPEYRRLLHGLYLAVYHYANRHQAGKLARRGRSSAGDPEEVADAG